MYRLSAKVDLDRWRRQWHISAVGGDLHELREERVWLQKGAAVEADDEVLRGDLYDRRSGWNRDWGEGRGKMGGSHIARGRGGRRHLLRGRVELLLDLLRGRLSALEENVVEFIVNIEQILNVSRRVNSRGPRRARLLNALRPFNRGRP